MSFETGGHFYHKDGTPCYTVPRAKGGGQRATTLADAKKMGLLPSVTTILRCVDKPALTQWLIKTNVEAALTTPRIEGEDLDAFMERVMSQDAQEEGQKARDKGTEIHADMERYLSGNIHEVDPLILPWIEPAGKFVMEKGEVVVCEKTLVGCGYAGKCDLILRLPDGTLEVVDFKTTKKLPRKAWDEHLLQGAMYANVVPKELGIVSQTSNLYISTVEQGAYIYCGHEEPWLRTYEMACVPLLLLWQWLNSYNPNSNEPL